MTLDINSEIYRMDQDKDYFIVLASVNNISDGICLNSRQYLTLTKDRGLLICYVWKSIQAGGR